MTCIVYCQVHALLAEMFLALNLNPDLTGQIYEDIQV